MEWRVTSLVLLAALSPDPQATLRSESAGQPISIVESRARAILGEKTIRLELPLAAPAAGNEHIVAWLLSPSDLKSSDTESNLDPRAETADLVLPWPGDGNGNPVGQIGWYRIGYRIDRKGAPAGQGVLSVGAIAPNLLALRLSRPSKIVAGMPISVRVFAGNPVTRRPFKDVRLEATLSFDENSGNASAAKHTVVRQAITGENGEATFSFPGTARPGETASLRVNGSFTTPGVEGAFTHDSVLCDIETDNRTVIHAETDKPLHKPGETVHLRALALNDAGRAAANTALKLTITDSQNKTIEKIPLTTNGFGIASYDWKTRQQTATGDYDASFEMETDSDHESEGSSVTVRIERYDLPEFAVSATMDRGFYLQGQQPTVRIHAAYLFGKPVAAGTLKIARTAGERWNPKTRKVDQPENTEQSRTLDSDGNAEIRLDVKKDFDELRSEDYRRYTDLQYRATVTDASTGRSEPRNFTVRLTHNAVHIYVTRLGGNDREGEYMVSTSYADGVPAACRLMLDWMDLKGRPTRASALTTNRYGLGKIHLVYPAREEAQGASDSVNLRLTALDREGRTSKFDDTLNRGSPGATWITVAHSLLRPGEPIAATVHGSTGDTVDVDALSEAGVMAHLQVHLVRGAAPVSIPAEKGFHGVVTLSAYTLSRGSDEEDGGVGGSRSVLYPEDRELRIKLVGLKSSYPPGADVSASLDVNDAAGAFRRGAAGISVFDSAVEQRATTEDEANEPQFGGDWWLSGPEAGGVTRAMLDSTNTSKAIPEDLDLAAEAVLAQEQAASPSIEGASDDTARTAYADAMKDELKPVGDAIVAFPTVRLPHTMEWIRAVTRTAKLDQSRLVDPWNTEYRVDYATESADEVVAFTSAGPDKRFDTGDDIRIPIAKRSIFAMAGQRLTEILQTTAAAEEPLPGTVDALKALAKSNGLDLDSAAQGTLNLDGKPFRYAIAVRGRSYFVEVQRRDGIHVWTSPGIDYFSRNEASMDRALQSWTARGRQFPNTEGDARRALSAAGIDFDTLRDPLGKRFQLRPTELMTYTRNMSVKAGGELQVSSKPVTHIMRAIQVVRTPDPGTPAEQAELVTQFLHPITEQNGSEFKPQRVDQGAFKGNTGAIGGAVTDATGAAVPDAIVTATTAGGYEFTAKTLANGAYLVRDLAPGVYSVRVSAPGFQVFSVRDVYVSAASLTSVDVQLSVGAATETVEVSAGKQGGTLATMSAQVASLGVMASSRKTVVTTPTGSATISEPNFTPRLRHVFQETAYWAPSLETNASGRAELRFRLPDSLTTWKLHTVVSTVDGRLGALDQTFKTFQPFFVDLDAPQVLTKGDEITLPVNLRNYTAQILAVPVTVKPAGWLQPLTATTLHANVPANGSAPVAFGFRAAKTIDQGPLQITAATARTGDAVEKRIRVHPDGEPGSADASALLRGQAANLQLELPVDLIPGSLHAELRIYPNLASQIVHSIKAALERPYGCGEQTISSTYPSLLFLEVLKASNSKSPLESEAKTYLQLGYDRLLSYFNASGGLTYWGGNDHEPDPALTAYGLTFLLEADSFIKVDHERITAAVRWLLDHQQSEGAWKPHYGSPSADLVLYVAAALSAATSSPGSDAAGELNPRIRTAISKAIAWASKSVASVHDPYVNALRLELAGWSQDTAEIARLRRELASTAVRDRSGAHWTREEASPFYGWGRAGDLETTAIALSALRGGSSAPAEPSLMNDVLLFLLSSHDSYGIWYSGQATVRVLQALLPFAIEQMKNTGASASFSLVVNGSPLSPKDADALQADPRLLEAPRTLDVTAMLKPGKNDLVFTGTSDTALASADIAAAYYIPWTAGSVKSLTITTPGKDYGLNFGYQCPASEARAGRPIQCTVDVRRFGSGGYGMLLAEVGLPPGADVDRASLARVLDSGTISRYELQPDRIIFYLWSWSAEGTHFKFAFTPRYPIHAKASPATLFDYYNPDLKVVLTPQVFAVQ